MSGEIILELLRAPCSGWAWGNRSEWGVPTGRNDSAGSVLPQRKKINKIKLKRVFLK